MNVNCCVTSVPHHGSFEAFPKAVRAWQERLVAGLNRSIEASDQTMGHLEEEMHQKTQEVERVALEEAAQKKADQSPPVCPVFGMKLTRATLDREARRQGRRAQDKRQQMDEQMSQGAGGAQLMPELRLPMALEPFTLVIELDAWNIRERNQEDWGRTEQLRLQGQEPKWWHWVYGGTCFRLSQRVQTQSGRSLILSRGTVMTRGGLDALKEQLWAEAMRHGLSQAQQVLVIADGAVWIWNLVSDRFAGARQRLDPWHALQHLWTVAHALHPEDEAAAAAWIKPLKEKLLESQAVEVITELDDLLKRLQGSQRKVVQTERDYLQSNKHRLDYKGAQEAGEPLGSGAMESTCRQYQVRFHRSGQFWTTQADEALMCLETFWRNARWRLLFPHVPPDFDPSKN